MTVGDWMLASFLTTGRRKDQTIKYAKPSGAHHEAAGVPWHLTSGDADTGGGATLNHFINVSVDVCPEH